MNGEWTRLLDLTARRYGVRPSSLLGLDGFAALAVDMACAIEGTKQDAKEKIGEWWWLRVYDILGGSGGSEEVSWL